MEIKILQVFYGKDGLPYKDKDRQVHFPIAGTGFLGASNTTKIKFYYDELDNLDETTWVAVSKLPNGKVGSRVLESYLDEELNEHYALLELDNYYTQYKGDVFISLQGYQGGVNLDYDEENSQYEIHGTPTIAATGSIKFTINYANQFIGSGETDNINFQRILAELGTKLGIRAKSEFVEELPTVGESDTFYVINNDLNDPNKANIYIWNNISEHYIWVGDNSLDLGEYYTKNEGEYFESVINERVESVENELESVASGSPRGVYSTLAALQAAYPTGNNSIYVVSEDGKWYYWNGSAWTAGGTYQAIVENSVSYTDLNNDLKTQIDSLNVLTNNGVYKLTNSDMVQGSYGSAGARVIVTNTARIRTQKPIMVRNGDQITIEKGDNCSYFAIGYYNLSGVYINENDWSNVNKTIKFDSDRLVVIAFKNSTNTTLYATDFDANVIIEKALNYEKIKKIPVIEQLVENVSSFNDLVWEYGYIASDGNIQFDGSNLCSTQFIYVEKGTTITPSNGYKIKLSYYSKPDPTTYFDYVAFRNTAYTVGQNVFIRISLAKPDNSSIADRYSILNNYAISGGYKLNLGNYEKLFVPEKNQDAVDLFIEKMNAKAQKIGMTNSIFADVAGYNTATNRVTAKDLVKLGINACGSNELCSIWGVSGTTLTTLDGNHRTIQCDYVDDVSDITNYYTLLGKKPGYMPLDGGGSSFTMLAVCIVEGKAIVGAIGGATSSTNRVKAIKELMDNVKLILNGQSANTPYYYQYGAAAILPPGNPVSWEGQAITYLYDYNGDTQFVPASTTKVLTCLTALDYTKDLKQQMKVLSSDGLDYGSGQLLQNGDILNMIQLLYLILLPSSGPACRVLARVLGQKMLLNRW